MEDRDQVALYEEVARLTDKMLSAARQADWDGLTELEAGCAQCVEKLKGCPAAGMISAEVRSQKVALLKTILANDREIRQLASPWMAQLNHLLGTANRQCKRARSYGPASNREG